MQAAGSQRSDVGVAIGRWQDYRLHEGHVALLNYIDSRYNRMIIFIGVPLTLSTKKDPLDFDTRRMMIQGNYPHAVVLPIKDHFSNEVWSCNVDSMIHAVYPGCSAALFGGPDGFVPSYRGKFTAHSLTCADVGLQYQPPRATERREIVAAKAINSEDFRAGAIYSAQNQYDRVYPTVDIAVTNKDGCVLLARKPGIPGFVFPGGFVDPSDDSYEHAAIRELSEETSIAVHGTSSLRYVTSRMIPDYRYKQGDKLMTTLFATEYAFGSAKAKDDIVDLSWEPVSNETLDRMAEWHQGLMRYFILEFARWRSKT